MRVSQNVVGLLVGETIVLGLCDTMVKIVSSTELRVVEMVMGIPLVGVQVECKYLYVFPERV